MLVVLIGDGLGVLVAATRLLEQFNRVNIRILILESSALRLASRFRTGPLPHCITAIPQYSQLFFQGSALNHGNSSIMYLMSIHRAPKRRVCSLEKPVAHESLIVKPCTFPSNAISYHPEVYSTYLRNILKNHKNVSFALVRSNQDTNLTIRNLLQGGDDLVIFNYQNENPNLSESQLSSVHWDGLPGWRMPDVVHWLKKKKGIPIVSQPDSNILKFEVYSNFTFFDLTGALITADLIIEHVKALLANANLRWSRL